LDRSFSAFYHPKAKELHRKSIVIAGKMGHKARLSSKSVVGTPQLGRRMLVFASTVALLELFRVLSLLGLFCFSKSGGFFRHSPLIKGITASDESVAYPVRACLAF
jgi:hypothetical protein